MQIEIMRHDGRTEDADGEIERLLAGKRGDRRHQPLGDRAPIGVQESELGGEANADRHDQSENDRLDLAEALPLETKHYERVEDGEQDADAQLDAEQQLEGERSAQHLGQVAGDDGDFRQQPHAQAGERVEVLPRQSREVLAGRDAEPRAQALQDDGGEARQHDHEEQPIAEFGTGLDVGRPVAGVHVADGDEQARTGETEDFLPGRAGPRDGDRAAHLGGAERRVGRRRQVEHVGAAADQPLMGSGSRVKSSCGRPTPRKA